MSVNAEGYRNESFESLETAVMETPRGRWFLEEYAKRQRSEESLAILEILRGLEKSISGAGPVSAPKSTLEKPIPQEQMKFFRKDEEIFSQATVTPGPSLSIVVGPSPAPDMKQPAEPKGAKLKIQRANATDFVDEPNLAVAMPELAETTPDAPEPIVEAAPATSAEPKQRIVIIRRPASEVSEIPMIDDKNSEVAA
jgi:hypothetical protein